MKTLQNMGKYNLNIYDTAVAWALTRYVCDHRNVLNGIMEGNDLEATKLATVLNDAAVWMNIRLEGDCERVPQGVVELVKQALDGFDGEKFIRSMDSGFAELLADLCKGYVHNT